MSILNLDSYAAIQSNLFVKITLPSSTLLFSDRLDAVTINGDSYTGLGKLLNITSTSSEIRSTSQDVTIVLSGVPNSSISDIVNSNIKGNPVRIIRGIFNATNGALLTGVSGNPVNRFSGYVNNIALEEEFEIDTRLSSNRILLQCSSNVDILNNKISGRKTNPASMKKFFASDISMDRVPALESSYFDFGAKK